MLLFTYLYGFLFIVSASALIYMALKTYRNVDIYYWTIVFLIAITTLGFLERSMAKNSAEAMMAHNLACIGSTLLPAVYFMGMLRAFKIHVKRIAKFYLYLIAILHMLLIWFNSTHHLYYSSFDIGWTKYGLFLNIKKGPLSFIHHLYTIPLTIAIALSCIHAFKHPEKSPRRTVLAFAIITTLIDATYLFQQVFHWKYDFFPFFFGIGSWMIALSYEHNFSHNINSIVSTMHDEGTETGYIAFNLKKEYLGANEAALDFLPLLKQLHLDKEMPEEYSPLKNIINQLIIALEEGKVEPYFLKFGDIVLRFKIRYFYIRKKGATGGYLISVKDDTEHQHYLSFVENYNKTLQYDIRKQTEHIRQIQEHVVMGLANMIENRDESTGGHVKRTSDVIKILVEYMIDNHIGNLDRSFADSIVRAAPMHDLGKISIDLNILCKPGKLTPEEYEIMKTHPVKSGEIVKTILGGVEEPGFIEVACNVARYHHEKWNGQGYPEQLKENDIPLEARIMAVADVYDALVSKRCYKEPMSFEEAARVMIESMGSHFDPMMKDVFLGCRLSLEEYYRLSADE